jgi:hypothetical protein
MRVFLLLTLAACYRGGTPAPAPVANRPAKAWCAVRDDELLAGGVLCHTDGTCARIGPAGFEDAERPAPLAASAATASETEVCTPAGCTKYGANLRAHVAKVVNELAASQIEFSATSNGATVVVNKRPWDVRGDRPLALTQPERYPTNGDTQFDATVIDNLLVIDWYACAGPCHVGQIVTSSGVAITPPGMRGYTSGYRAGPTLFAVHTQRGNVVDEPPSMLRVFDVRTGAVRATVELPESEDQLSLQGVAQLDATTVAALFAGPERAVIHRIVAGAKKSTTVELAMCPATDE